MGVEAELCVTQIGVQRSQDSDPLPQCAVMTPPCSSVSSNQVLKLCKVFSHAVKGICTPLPSGNFQWGCLILNLRNSSYSNDEISCNTTHSVNTDKFIVVLALQNTSQTKHKTLQKTIIKTKIIFYTVKVSWHCYFKAHIFDPVFISHHLFFLCCSNRSSCFD